MCSLLDIIIAEREYKRVVKSDPKSDPKTNNLQRIAPNKQSCPTPVHRV
jgi:hypothetical protein